MEYLHLSDKEGGVLMLAIFIVISKGPSRRQMQDTFSMLMFWMLILESDMLIWEWSRFGDRPAASKWVDLESMA